MQFIFKLDWLIAFLAGVALVFAFSPFHFYWLLLISPAVFYFLLSKCSPKAASLIGLFYGLGFFGIGVSWVFVAIYVFGGTSAWLAAIITVLFSMVLASFFALTGFILQKYFLHNTITKALVVFPALWALLEFVRSSIFTGFPWLLLGHAAPGSIFSGYAPIVGPYGTSFLIVFASNLCLMAVTPYFTKSWARSNLAWVFLIIFFVAAYSLRLIPWTHPVNKPLSVALVQGNIQQSLRWDPEEVDHILTNYRDLTKRYYQKDLIVWPEGAIPLPPREAKPFLIQLEENLNPTHGALITGLPIPVNLSYYNSVVGLGDAQGIYMKRHLVPFGEYVPFEKVLRGLIQFFNLPMSEMVPGEMHQALMVVHGIPVGVYICYEVAYDNVVRVDLPGAKFLITVSDDAWFGDSLAPAQHLQIGQFQALATGRPMLFVGNNGLTAILTAQGLIQSVAPQFKPTVLSGSISAYEGTTPWVKFGDAPWLFIILFGLVIVFFKK